MRVLLVTDSLGCPREEIKVSDTWTDQILRKWSSNSIFFYTYCKHGLSAIDIDINYIKEIEPDLIIIQIGIVDACRRALSRKEIAAISKIRGLRTFVKNFCNAHHYFLTSIRNVHYCTIDKFAESVLTIKEKTDAKMIFIAIAPAGEGLVKKVYNIEKDINDYNQAIKSLEDIIFINPYEKIDISDYILDDGHHLQVNGNSIVFQSISSAIDDVIRGEI